MFKFLRLAVLGLALAACSPQAPPAPRPRDNVTYAILEFDADTATQQSDLLDKTMEIERRRVDGLNAPSIVLLPQPPHRLRVEAPGSDVREFDRLINILTRPGVLGFHIVDEAADPSSYVAMEERSGRIALPNDSLNGELMVIHVDPIIINSDLENSNRITDEIQRPAIAFKLRAGGAQKFGKATTDNVGNRFAIVLDNHIVTAPNIRTPITGGSGQITGNFTDDEAEQIAIVLRSGELPVKLRVIERDVVP